MQPSFKSSPTGHAWFAFLLVLFMGPSASAADFSIQTHLLAYWARERAAFPVEHAVRMVTGVPAAAWGMHDRGALEEGKAADINVIDFERLTPNKLEVRTDLPGGSKRLVQGATGYTATIVAGKVVLRDGAHTGELPGRLLRNSSVKQRPH